MTYPLYIAIRSRQDAIDAISGLGDKLDADLLITISKPKSLRSGAQNRLYWLWINHAAMKTHDVPDDIHKMLKRELLADIYLREPLNKHQHELAEAYSSILELTKDMSAGVAIEAQQRVKALCSTTWAEVDQFSTYLGAIEDFYREGGIALPHPEDLYRLAHYPELKESA